MISTEFTKRSHHPPKYPASEPIDQPRRSRSKHHAHATVSETRAPIQHSRQYISPKFIRPHPMPRRGATSRVARFCAAGFAGAIHGANTATTNSAARSAKPYSRWNALAAGTLAHLPQRLTTSALADPPANRPRPSARFTAHRKAKSPECSLAAADNPARKSPERSAFPFPATKKSSRSQSFPASKRAKLQPKIVMIGISAFRNPWRNRTAAPTTPSPAPFGCNRRKLFEHGPAHHARQNRCQRCSQCRRRQ